MTSSPFEIVPLAKSHKRADFTCSDESLDTYLKNNISSDVSRNACKAYVLKKRGEDDVLGYYTLSPDSVSLENAPNEIRKKYRKRSIGVVLIGRYAVHSSIQGKGIGKSMLYKAYSDIIKVKEVISVAGVVVDARTKSAKSFWLSREYVRLSEESEGSEKFMIPMTYIEKIFSE